HGYGNGGCSGCAGSWGAGVGAQRAVWPDRFGRGVADSAIGCAFRSDLRSVRAAHECDQYRCRIQIGNIDSNRTTQHLWQRARVGDGADLPRTQMQGLRPSVKSMEDHFHSALQIRGGRYAQPGRYRVAALRGVAGNDQGQGEGLVGVDAAGRLEQGNGGIGRGHGACGKERSAKNGSKRMRRHGRKSRVGVRHVAMRARVTPRPFVPGLRLRAFETHVFAR
ncbi:UNVERIFIED_CONTAM: hypothetical protein LK11_66055, partial [Mumia flava]